MRNLGDGVDSKTNKALTLYTFFLQICTVMHMHVASFANDTTIGRFNPSG